MEQVESKIVTSCFGRSNPSLCVLYLITYNYGGGGVVYFVRFRIYLFINKFKLGLTLKQDFFYSRSSHCSPKVIFNRI